jgi:hypothetical protein
MGVLPPLLLLLLYLNSVAAVGEFFMMSRLLFCLGLALGFSSCGAKVEKSSVKSYVLGMKSGDEKYKPLIKQMIDDYNAGLGMRVLEFSDSMDDANCPVLITKGLEQRDGKVGWGQWFSQTERRGTVVQVPGTVMTETVRYSLQVELDQDFLDSNSKDAAAKGLNMEIKKLFAHEIGHGFQMSHDPTVSDVMYFDISGDKDFTTYWPRVRAFFESSN